MQALLRLRDQVHSCKRRQTVEEVYLSFEADTEHASLKLCIVGNKYTLQRGNTKTTIQKQQTVAAPASVCSTSGSSAMVSALNASRVGRAGVRCAHRKRFILCSFNNFSRTTREIGHLSQAIVVVCNVREKAHLS